MSLFRQRIADLEREAAQNELVAQLAADIDTRSRHQRSAAELRKFAHKLRVIDHLSKSVPELV
jgi:hypothetical protein